MARPHTSQRWMLLSAALGLAGAVAIPEPTPVPAQVEVGAPIVTPAAIRFDSRHSYLHKKDIINDIKSGVNGVAKSWESVIGSALPSFFTEGTFFYQGGPVVPGKACADSVTRRPRLVRRPAHWHRSTLEAWHQRRFGCDAHSSPQPSALRKLDRQGMECQIPRQCLQVPQYLAE